MRKQKQRLKPKRQPHLKPWELTADEWSAYKDYPENVPKEQTNEMQRIFKGRER